MSPESAGEAGAAGRDSGPGRGRGAWIALGLTVLAALALRAVGLDFGVPVWEEPDAVIAMHVEHLREGTERGDRRFSDQNYPHLVARLTQPLGGPAEPPGTEGGAVAAHLARAARTHVEVRRVVALLSLFAIPAAYLLARTFQGAGAGVFAALLTASSLLLFSFSQQGRPHAAAGGLLPLAVVAALGLVRRGRARDHALAGLAAAAALGVLQTGVFVLPALAVAFFARPRTGGRGGLARRALGPWALFHVGLLALAVLAFYPFLFGGELGNGAGRLAADGGQVRLAEHEVRLADFLDGGGFRVVWLALWNYDPALLLTGALGLVGVTLRRGVPERALERARELTVVLAFALPYLLVIGLYARTFERFAIPLLPFLAALAAVGSARVTRRWPVGARRALAALAVALPFATCVKLAALRARPDTLDLAGAWVASELGPDERVALPPAPRLVTAFDLPLWRRAEELAGPDGKRLKQHSPWTRYQLRVLSQGGLQPGARHALRWLAPRSPDENRLMAHDREAFVLSLAPAHYVIEPFEARHDHAAMVELRRTLAEHGELVARFTPEGPGGKIEWPFFYMLSDHFNAGGHEDWPHFLPRLLAARAIGPCVEIWRVDG